MCVGAVGALRVAFVGADCGERQRLGVAAAKRARGT